MTGKKLAWHNIWWYKDQPPTIQRGCPASAEPAGARLASPRDQAGRQIVSAPKEHFRPVSCGPQDQ